MDRSPGFGSITYDLYRPFQTRFHFGSIPYEVLNLAIYNNSLDRSTKSTISHFNVLYLLVNIGFQVLFHSPPGVLFTFPSRYYSLSVIWSYLALRDGPRAFRQDSSCPDVLRILLGSSRFRLRDCHPLRSGFHSGSAIVSSPLCSPYPECITTSGLGFSDFARHYFRNRFYFLFLRVLRCFSSPRSPLYTTLLIYRYTVFFYCMSFLIRISTD